MSHRLRGYYIESCNCEAICPCRMIGGVPGGRSTYGVCFGLLAWRVDDGTVDGLDVSGLNVALSCRYDDDEPGSPWTVTLYVDERGAEEQRDALADVFLRRLPLPWVRKARHLLGVEAAAIEIAEGEARVGDTIRLRATAPVETDLPVACGIPGYDHVGEERYADVLAVLGTELHGNCAYVTDFDYAADA